jgi:hypothetical protein
MLGKVFVLICTVTIYHNCVWKYLEVLCKFYCLVGVENFLGFV